MADEKQGIGAKVKARLARARARYPWFDHVMRMNEHYGNVEGNILAGAVTYFGFLSFFPVLALSFAVIGYVSIAYPGASDSLATAIEQIFPGIVSQTDQEGKISLEQIESAKAAAGVIGFVGVLYSGLGWLSGLRTALLEAFVVPDYNKPSFVKGKAVDLLVLAILGAVLVVSVGVSGVAKGLTDRIVGFLGLSGSWVGAPLVWAVGIALGLAASTLLFYVMFRVLAAPTLPSKALWQGALLGAVGFEVLKLLVVNLLGSVGGNAFAPLAIAITLVVWINYFSRLVIYGAAWAYTAVPTSTTQVAAAEAEAVAMAPVLVSPGRATADETPTGRMDPRSAVMGAVAGAVAATFISRRR
jgi:membrane protein